MPASAAARPRQRSCELGEPRLDAVVGARCGRGARPSCVTASTVVVDRRPRARSPISSCSKLARSASRARAASISRPSRASRSSSGLPAMPIASRAVSCRPSPSPAPSSRDRTTSPLPPAPLLIASTTSCPATTSPTTVYWPSRCGAGANMMKNWLLAEFGSIERAMPTVPLSKCSPENSAGRSGRSEPPVPARPCAEGVALAVGDVAGLRHEAVDHPVEHHAVVGAGARQLLDAGDVLRREVGPQRDLDRALAPTRRRR